ncbi:DHA2 family efflux MFS transporter permease subunit [soil metagenome]
MMIVFRALQGFVGGAMIPTVFAIAFTAFPPSQRVTASMVIGLIVTLLRQLVPRWGGASDGMAKLAMVVFINIAPGVVSLFLVSRYARFDQGDPSLAKGFDWLELALMTVSLSLQFVLEEGAKGDWFSEERILGLALIAAVTGPFFGWRCMAYRNLLVELRPFANRNFTVVVTMAFIVGSILYGVTFLMPLFLARVGHYSFAEVGITMVVSGLAKFATTPFAGHLVRLVDPRILMCGGFFAISWGMWDARMVTEEGGFWQFASVQALRGAGAMIAAQQVTMSTLPPHMVKNASGLVNLSRHVGGTFSLAWLNTSLTTNTNVHMVELTSRITQSNQAMQDMIAGMASRMAMSIDPNAAAVKSVYGILLRQATTLAFGDALAMLAGGCVVAGVASLFAKPGKPGAGPAVEAH